MRLQRWFNDEMNDEFVQCLIWTKTNYRSMSSRLFSVFNAVEHNYRSREMWDNLRICIDVLWNWHNFRANYTEFFKKFEKYGQLGNFYQINKGNDQNKNEDLRLICIVLTKFSLWLNHEYRNILYKLVISHWKHLELINFRQALYLHVVTNNISIFLSRFFLFPHLSPGW